MQLAVSIPPFTDARTIVDMAVDAERAGWDAVFVWDHLQWVADLELDVHDPWSLLSAMAVSTERIKLGTCVTPLSRRRPQVVAKQLITLDHLSQGRAVLGVGLGEPPDDDFAAFGDEADPGVRAERLDEALTLIDRLTRGETVDHDGPHFRVDATLRPGPVSRPRPPILVAGVAPHRRPLNRALRWDGMMPIGSDELLTPAALAAYLGGVDRPPHWQLFAFLHPEHRPDEYEAVGADWLIDGLWPAGEWVADLRRLITDGPPR